MRPLPTSPPRCSSCRQPNTRNGRYCHSCHAAFMRRWRAANKASLALLRADLARLREQERQALEAAPAS